MELKINEPCHEDLDKMKVGMDSRHCDSCVKSVIDFTQMDRGQIITYLLMRPNERVCGRMHRSQMDFRHEDVPLIIEAIQKHRPANAFMILALVTLTLASCSQPNGAAPAPQKTKSIQVEKDSLQTSKKDSVDHRADHEMGKVSTKDRGIADKTGVTPTVCPPLVGIMVIEPDPIDLGDIEMPEPPPPPPPQDDTPRTFVETMPEYVGGIDAMMAFIKTNLRFTEEMKASNLEGTVYLKMVVETDGSLSNFEVLRGVSGSLSFEKEAIRMVKSMPKWTPGKDKGKVCRTYMSLPIRFKR